jgi:hypothetical protein
MMDQYLSYLRNKEIIKPSQRSFYIKWVTDLHRTCHKEPGPDISQAEIDAYLSKLVRKYQDWQVDQAKDAIRLYLYYFDRGWIVVRSAKGDKDREAMLPQGLNAPLKMHLEKIRNVFEKDRADEIEGVYLPGALERKYPSANKEWKPP